jgi:phage-related protein (TIGR01555 family)
MANITESGGVVNLGHNGQEDVRIDGLQNVFTGMGTSRDKTTRTTVSAITFMNKEDLEGLYVHWLTRRIVDLVANECTREGFEILFGGEGVNAQTLSGVEQAIEDLEILQYFNEAAKTSRLYGGSALVLYIDDGRPAYMPVDRNNIRSVEGMECLDRHQIAPIISEESLYDYSKATYYQIISGDLIQQPNLFRIHKDRILRFDGIWLPYRVRQKNYGWGMSVLQSVYESFKHYYTGTSSIATLLTEFDVFVHKVRGLASMLAAGKESQVKNRLELNDMSKSIYRGYAIDAEKEELEFVGRQFGGVPEILEKLRVDIIGASGIPHTLLFGQSPSGLGATGRSEERDFAKTCHHYQETHLRRQLQKLMTYVMLSKNGPTKGQLPENWRIGWKPLFEMNERELADVRARVAAVDARYIQVGVLTPQEVADSRFGKSEYSIETTIDPSIRRELPEKAAKGDVPPGGRDPLDQANGTLPMDGTRNATDSEESVNDEAGLFLPRDLEHIRGDVKFTDKSLHNAAVAAAKSKFKVWPSAYASGYVVQHYKAAYKKKHGSLSGAFKNDDGELHADDLDKWFKEKWVRIGANGEILGPCGAREKGEGKPKCLPEAKAQGMSKEARKTIVARKRRKDPNANRKGKAKMVSSKVDAIEPIKAEGLILSDIDEASLVTEEDVQAALSEWKQQAPERFKDILEAEDAEPSK